jgi:hypothetical protein
MTETAPDPQETTGRTRIVVTLITASVPVVIAAISLMSQMMGPTAAEEGPGASAAVATVASRADPEGLPEAAQLKRWKITGALDATEGSGPVYAGLHLMPLERSLETMTDDQGRFAFDDVPAGAYCLLVKTFGAGDGHYIKLRIEKRGAGPVEEFSVEGTPVDFTIIEQ